MLAMKYLLEIAGIVLMAAAAAILLHDLYRLYQQSNLILNHQTRPAVIEPHYATAGQITALAIVCLLAGVGPNRRLRRAVLDQWAARAPDR